VLSGSDTRTKVTHPAGVGRGVIVTRGTYLYRKCVLFHRPRQRVQRTDRPVSRPSAPLFIFFTFGIAREGRQHEGRRIQKHYKTQFPASAAGAIFRAAERRGWANAAGAQCVLDETSIVCRGRARAQREGVVSISGAKRLPRN